MIRSTMHRVQRSVISITAVIAALALAATAVAEPPLLADELPPELQGVGIVQRLDEKVDLDLPFVDEKGDAVTLATYLSGDKPAILTLNYYRCPMLCTLTLNGLTDALNRVELEPGVDFDIITVSINPAEGPDLAAMKKKAYLTQYQHESAANGWHFLTGKEPDIKALAKAVGFGYRFDEKSGEFAHTSTIVFITSDGRISRYMDDVRFEPKDVRLALVEASEGKIGTALDNILLFTCFRYDPNANGYVVSAIKLMQLGGALTVIAIALGFFVLWRTDPRRRRVRAIAIGGVHP